MMTRLQRWLIATGLILLLPACVGGPSIPDAAPPAIEVRVPYAVPCVLAEVPQETLPSSDATADMNIFELTQRALADRKVLEGENSELRVVNEVGCPEITP